LPFHSNKQKVAAQTEGTVSEVEGERNGSRALLLDVAKKTKVHNLTSRTPTCGRSTPNAGMLIVGEGRKGEREVQKLLALERFDAAFITPA
jgi:hypothetical protein